MKKFILTESQFKMVIDSVLNEGLIQEQRGQFLKLKDLAEISSRVLGGRHYEIFLEIYIDVYRDRGSEGIIEMFESATDLKLEDMGYGRYMIK